MGQLTPPGWGRVGSALTGDGAFVSSSPAPVTGGEDKPVSSRGAGQAGAARSSHGPASPHSISAPAGASAAASGSRAGQGDADPEAEAREAEEDESDFDEDDSDSDSDSDIEYDEEIEKHICQLHAQVENLRRESAGFKIQQQQLASLQATPQATPQVTPLQPEKKLSTDQAVEEAPQEPEAAERSSKRQKTAA